MPRSPTQLIARTSPTCIPEVTVQNVWHHKAACTREHVCLLCRRVSRGRACTSRRGGRQGKAALPAAAETGAPTLLQSPCSSPLQQQGACWLALSNLKSDMESKHLQQHGMRLYQECRKSSQMCTPDLTIADTCNPAVALKLQCVQTIFPASTALTLSTPPQRAPALSVGGGAGAGPITRLGWWWLQPLPSSQKPARM